jgi:hypothetical protein
VYSSVCPDDETDLHFGSGDGRKHEGIGCSQSFGWLGIFAPRARSGMRNVAELRCADGSFPRSILTFGQYWHSNMRGRSLNRSGGRKGDQKYKPETTKHRLRPHEDRGQFPPPVVSSIGKCSARL